MRGASEHRPPMVQRGDLSHAPVAPAYASCPPAAARSHVTVQTALARLANTPFPPLRYVGCEFDRGTLTLHGRVPTFYLKQVAQEAVRAVSGVRQVMNEIQVGP